MKPKPLTSEELRGRIRRLTGYGELLRRAWVDDWLAECGAGGWYWNHETLVIQYGHYQQARIEPIHVPNRGLFYSVNALSEAVNEARKSA